MTLFHTHFHLGGGLVPADRAQGLGRALVRRTERDVASVASAACLSAVVAAAPDLEPDVGLCSLSVGRRESHGRARAGRLSGFAGVATGDDRSCTADGLKASYTFAV
jgi:hypothetical protein